eukprot:TRINITY_DN12587_c0_g1_i1.p1 TRINITY_DN12587_c0_g1~~TRINITY_DN12587_c0_g1_i1.p1  ORF type:complete len:347 (+),score=28.25 TRINITY_DN12587_c0_g1_i1:174-1214(+)
MNLLLPEKKVLILMAYCQDYSSHAYQLPSEVLIYIFSLVRRKGWELSTTFKHERKWNPFHEGTLGYQQFWPRCVALDNQLSRLVVSYIHNDDHQIQVASTDGKTLGTFGHNGTDFDQPTGVAVSPNTHNIFICDTNNNRIQVSDREGNFLNVGGKFGSNGGHLSNPWAITASDDERIYVTNGGSNFIENGCEHSVQAFSAKGEFLFSFGQYGFQNGHFNLPKGIVSSHYTRKVYVSDCNNRRIQAFAPNGVFLFSFPAHVSYSWKNEPDLFSPWGLSVDEEDNIYVVDHYHNRIHVYDYRGRYLVEAVSSTLKEPWDIATNSEGDIWVADNYNHHLQLYTKNELEQ